MTNEDRTSRLRELGYNETEASFLLLTALHSGCFVMRQYTNFAEAPRGRLTDQFATKAALRRHIRSYPSRNRTVVYQVGKGIFEAIGDPDNRNRRIKQIDLTRLRLMSLDYVLLNQQRRYFATEVEKLEYFQSLGTETAVLPCRVYLSNFGGKPTTRHFIEKYPIFERGAGAGFAFMDEGSMTSFESFLRRYLPLLGVLPEAEVVYVGTSEARLEAARTVFERTTQGSLGQIDFVPFEIEFRERELLEQGIQEATQTQLERLRLLRKSRLAPLFHLWKAQGRTGIEALLLLKPTHQSAASAVFSPYLLPCGYSFL